MLFMAQTKQRALAQESLSIKALYKLQACFPEHSSRYLAQSLGNKVQVLGPIQARGQQRVLCLGRFLSKFLLVALQEGQ